MGVDPSFFASEWFSTLFAYGFPMASTFRIWDVLFLEDKEYIFKICLAMVYVSKGLYIFVYEVQFFNYKVL